MRFFGEGLLRTLAILAAPSLVHGAPWVVITEIHYNPPEGEAGEFVEVLSREPPRADLSGWRIEGEIDFVFPAGTVLPPGERAVIARSPGAVRRRRPGGGLVLGPFSRKLDNKGGRLALRNAAGALVCEVPYENGGRWPSVPDGTGHTLSLLDPHLDPSDPGNWAASARLGGTPGAANFPRAAAEGTLVLENGEEWLYFKGLEAPSPVWKDPGFPAAGWLGGRMGIGYGDGDDATEIADMQGSYMSIFARKAFPADPPPPGSRLILRVDYDDGFIAYLNGKEAARAGMGEPGTEVHHAAPAASRHEAGVPVEMDLGPAAGMLRAGENVIAVQVHNDDLDSSDLTISIELEIRKPPAGLGKTARPLLNEVLLEPGAGMPPFVEVYNAGSAEIDLAGAFLTDDPRDLRKLKLPGPARVGPGKFLVIGEREIAGKLSPGAGEVFLALTAPEGDRVLDLLRFGVEEDPAGEGGEEKGKKKNGNGKQKGKPGRGPIHRGRFPDGERMAGYLDPPTPGAPNRAPVTGDLVINEIMYHPLWGEDLEYIEILNRGSEPAPLDGFRITGGIRHAFEAGTSIPPGGHLVVARDPDALARRHGLSREKVAGPFRGRLSNRGEEITLRDPRGNVADRVAYADARPWPRWTDGLGSSLELIDPALDNSIPAAWAPSDDRSKAKWQSFSYAKEHRTFNTSHNIPELQVLLLNEGECLIDDFRFRGERDLVADGSFERGAPGWDARGTHELSGVQQGDAARGKACYRIAAEGRGNARHNNISIAIPSGLQPGRRYQVAFRAKWQRGCMVILTRTGGQGVARAHRLTPPEKLGTPGAENSTRSSSGPPAVSPPRQDPVLPVSGEAVTFAARISGRSRIASASIRYRAEGAAGWSEAPLADGGRAPDLAAGDGIWSGEVPALPSGSVEFHIAARDSGGAEGTWPEGAPGRTALYVVGAIPSARFPTYTVVMSDAEWQALERRPPLSNRLADATLIYGDSRIFYQVGVRRRGSPFTRSRGRNWRVVFGAERLDGRGSLTVDGQSGDGTNLSERLTYWACGELHAPNVRQQYVYFRIPGEEEGIYEDVEKIDGRFLESWFEPAQNGEEEEPAARKQAAASGEAEPGGNLHKVDDYFELFANGGQDYDEAELEFKSPDPEDYRWNFPPRANGPAEDFAPLLELIRLFDPRATPDRTFLERVEKAVEVDEWLRVLAARTLSYDWDTLGLTRGKNSMLYLAPADGKWRLLPWDCDLSWQLQHVQSPLYSDKFAGIRRMLDHPPYRRRFLGYLAYLAERKLEPTAFERVLEDLRAYSGARVDPWRDFARGRRAFVLGQIPAVPFQLADSRRVQRSKEPDILRASGTAPIIAMRFRLLGPGSWGGATGGEQARRSEGTVRFIDEARWVAEIPIGPEGGDAVLEALDFGGTVVASAAVAVRARKGALPLPEEPAVPAAPELAAGEDGHAAPGDVSGEPSPPATAPVEPPAVEVAAVVSGSGEEATVPGEVTPATGEVEAAAREASGTSVIDPPEREGSLLPEEAEVIKALEKEARKLAAARENAAASSGIVERRYSPGSPGGEEEAGEPRAAPPVPETVEEEEPEAAAGEAAAAITPPPEGGGSIPWRILIPLAVLLAGIQAGLIIIARRRRAAGSRAPARAADPAARTEVLSRPVTPRDATVSALAALGSTRYEEAAKALRRLSMGADIEALLEALADPRPTPFQKIRRAADGSFTAVACRTGTGIGIRHIAALLLGEALGKPPVPKPGRADWEALWKASGGRVRRPARTPPPRARGAGGTTPARGPT